MEFPKPETNIVTIYSKTGCINCGKVKLLLEDAKINYVVIDCDEFLLHNKDEFLNFIKQIANQECKMFPMVFDSRAFIGGFKEVATYIEMQEAFNNVPNSDDF